MAKVTRKQTAKTGKAAKSAKAAKMPASICWFEVPAEDIARAKKFYGRLFGWTFAKIPAAIHDYWHIDTAGKDASPDGGLMPRMYPEQGITNYVAVPSVSRAAVKVQKLGGSVCKPKTEVPGMGSFAVFEDTEGNVFALWEPLQRKP